MARSVSVAVVAPLLLLSVLVSTAAAARTVGDTVQDACSKTQFPKICVDSLAAKPESQKATPRKLAELFVNIAAEKGAGMATFVHGKYNAAKDNAGLFKCYDSCSDDVEEAVAHLNGLVREPTDAKFLELKSWLSSTLGGTSTCEDACKDAPKSGDKDDVVNFSLDFEKLQRVTLDLITEASGSMSAGIALPPSDAGAPSYGAAAPADAPAGAGAGSEGPASSAASGPSSGGDAPAYGGSAASGPADADAPAAASSGPSGAPAPTSSDSSGAPWPSSAGGSSSAPAPSSGGDDDDDDDDSNADGSA
ncbi:putative invertase inhibitor [Miscanthus floridulus]|uniref:putative invertase inhibitor n=1 Tax=Miscanthus floridulus TaxID=154761 RepID=UPI003457D327